MGQEIKLQTELYEKYWFPMEQSYGNEYTDSFDWFMRDLLSVKTGTIPRIGRVYESFKAYVSSGKAPETISEVVQEIHKYSSYYVNMALQKETNPVLLKGFKNIAKLKVDVCYPFLLPVYDDFAAGIISVDDFSQIISFVENYVFRRAICGIPTNSLNKTFATLYKSINQTYYLQGVKAGFQLMEGYKRFPSDIEFEKEIIVKDLYNFRNRNYLLSKLENFKRKEFVNVDDYTIEHIMPQNPDLSREWQIMLGSDWKELQTKYLHSLGNLTLTGYNSELSDKPFMVKKTMEGGFNDSPIRINNYLRKVDTWNTENIEIRAKELAGKAKQIWFAPDLIQEELGLYQIEEKTFSLYTLDQYEHLTGEMLNLYYSLKKRILNIDSSVKEEYKKLYIAFKASTNFVDIVPQKIRLRLSLNIEYSEIVDSKGLCKDVSGLGRWGNGDVEVSISNLNEIDDVMELIQQSFDKQLEYL